LFGKAGWEAFEAKMSDDNCGEISLSDIPFPRDGKVYHIGNKDFKKLAMRWHPDKFLQRYGNKLRLSQKDEIIDRVKATFQQLNAAR